MRIVETISGLEKIGKSCVLTIGNYDGVHIGHQEILIAARRIAEKRAAELVVMTFEPHPLAVLRPQRAFDILTPLVLKKYLLAEFGVDCLFVLDSTVELLNLSPQDFVQQFIVDGIRSGVVVEGESFNFGSGRTGNIHTLCNLGIDNGFEVIVIEPREARLSIGPAVKVSSTIIRSILASGLVADAAIALGRAYRLIGGIIPGRGKGKQLGFPTLNLEKPNQIIPAEGVYAGFVGTGDSEENVCKVKAEIPAAFSIGRTATYGQNSSLQIEAHLLKENVGDLIGKYMAMDFVKHIREQQKFDSEAELTEQIAKDCEKAREILTTDTAGTSFTD